MLEVKDLVVNYGAVEALKGISFHIDDGEIVTLIGANGAGKTTTMHTISGLVRAKSGSIIYNNEDLMKIRPSKLITKGIAHVPEGRHVFPDMTVDENLDMGAYACKDKAKIEDIRADVFDKFPRLKERRRQLAGTLSGGEQQMLAVGRALMMRPKLLMMDEPSLGLAPIVMHDIFKIIETLHAEGITILLVEQNANAALKIADYAFVLETGSLGMQGTGSELLNDPSIKAAYLGKSR